MSSYRSLLLELSNSLTTADLQELKFLCGDVIPAGRLERINRGFELFGALEQLNKTLLLLLKEVVIFTNCDIIYDHCTLNQLNEAYC